MEHHTHQALIWAVGLHQQTKQTCLLGGVYVLGGRNGK